jgi:hypothetical protein
MFLWHWICSIQKNHLVFMLHKVGLDENRQAYLISTIQNTAKELSNYPMLVTLCEVCLFLFLSFSTMN